MCNNFFGDHYRVQRSLLGVFNMFSGCVGDVLGMFGECLGDVQAMCRGYFTVALLMLWDVLFML